MKFHKLQKNDVIVSWSIWLAFNLTLTSTDADRTVVTNVGRAIISRAEVKICNEVGTTLDSADVFGVYADLWRSGGECLSGNGAYQGISSRNALRLRVGAGNANASVVYDKAEADAYGNRFASPLDFGLLSGHSPYHPDALYDWFTYILLLAPNEGVVIANGDADATYTLNNLTLEYETVNHEGLAQEMHNRLKASYPAHFTDKQRFRREVLDLTFPTWTVMLNIPRRSTTAVVLLFVDPTNDGCFARNPESFVNPKIMRADVTIEGSPNQLYAQGIKPYQHWGEAMRVFGSANLSYGGGRNSEIGATSNELNTSSTTLSSFLMSRYAFVVDLRSTDDDALHGSGRKLGSGSVGMSIEIQRTPSASGRAVLYHYVLSDKQLNFHDGRLEQVLS